MPIKLLHLSDTHFTHGLREGDRSLYRKLVSRGGLSSHDFLVVSALSNTLRRMVLRSGQFDLIVVTGDISTDGDTKSLKTALDFFSRGEISTGKPGHFIVNGLKGTNRGIVLLPGNHDRYITKGLIRLPFQLNFGNFESVFNLSDKSYPFIRGIQNTVGQKNNEANVLLFVFDSSAVNCPPFDLAPAELIARGYIDNAACEWLELKADTIRKEGAVTGLDGTPMQVDYDRCVKIVALHHHPVTFLRQSDLANVSRSERQAFERHATESIKAKWTTLENRERFVAACFKANIDLTIFGHQHEFLHRQIDENNDEIPIPASPSIQGIHFICCPTSTQLTNSQRGFSVYTIEAHQFHLDYHFWDEGENQFVRDRSASGTFPFLRGLFGIAKGAQ